MHPRNDYLEFPPPHESIRNYFFFSASSCGFRDLDFRRYIFFFIMISFLPFLPSSSAIFFFLFIQRIHRCGYTKLERYYFCLHVNNSMSRVVCNAIVNTRVSLVSISMSRSMVLSNVLTSNRSFERYIFALLLSLFFFFFNTRKEKN